MSREEIVHAYRYLYRQGLRAVQFSKPARYTLRDRLRLSFRKGDVTDFSPQKVDNTLQFLRYATSENGLEHKILKNLLFVWWYQERGGLKKKPGQKKPTPAEVEIKTTAYDTFNYNIQMLNETMGMCLPAMIVRDPN
ncbi:DUF1763-domain-containing protein [Lindgomyces ingoldianus]|uniref:DUF1763-domain-containing protein n=1 Tax=Lindgomyces ingoldianus TaxID=673940 RepID=A0ACB6R6G7_9PLEO|nr:DUF1763-domain-containing protein [Lindgomyces ingoldianus]KAF2473902.1 DUF1763-domain-containing protein [Lindgomyces ingoldianus]